jgi:hypothetical protein
MARPGHYYPPFPKARNRGLASKSSTNYTLKHLGGLHRRIGVPQQSRYTITIALLYYGRNSKLCGRGTRSAVTLHAPRHLKFNLMKFMLRTGPRGVLVLFLTDPNEKTIILIRLIELSSISLSNCFSI